MLLAIDSGNTNIVFAVYGEDRHLRGSWRASTEAKRTADEYAVWLTQLMALEGLTPDDVDGAIIASVVPPTMHALTTLCRRYFKVTPLVIGEPGTDTGIEVRIARPDQVGADRLVNAIAAFAEHGGPLIVIDFGTATTFDVIGSDGAYEGGVIAPGINLSLEALDRAAAKLPRIAIKEPPQQVIGQATIPAMESGAYWGYVGLIEGLVTRIKGEYGQPMKVVATGGLASLFSRATDSIDEVDPDLTLRGLLAIYRANVEAAS
ncbi:MAG: type III pantothenate kinase [Alphaproteobacteria bacterium]